MDEETQEPKPITDIVEIVLFGIIFLICDFIELIPLAGNILDIVVGAPFDFYLWMRGLNMTAALIDQAIEFIPAVQEIPLWTITWGIIIYLDHHPKLTEKLQPALAIAGAVEGNIDGATGGLEEAERISEESTKAIAASAKNQETAWQEARAGNAGASGEQNIADEGKSGKPSEEPTEKEKRTKKEFGAGEGEMEMPGKDERGGDRENPGDEDLESAATGEERALLGEKGRLNEEIFERPMQIPVPPEENVTTTRSNVVSGEKFREAQKIEDIKRQQQKPKPIQEVPIKENNENKDELKKVA
jgi:hypothetical protein